MAEDVITGAESLVLAAVQSGVRMCFANPGTTEMPLVAALDRVPGIRAVLGLHENVCTGAADGYARITGRAARCAGSPGRWPAPVPGAATSSPRSR